MPSIYDCIYVCVTAGALKMGKWSDTTIRQIVFVGSVA